MLFLLIKLGRTQYAIDTGQVAQILPLVHITGVADAPVGVAGVFSYAGALVPVVDLSQLALGRPAERRFSTRLVLVHYPDKEGRARLLGLIAEQTTEVVRRDPKDFVSSGIGSGTACCDTPAAGDRHGIIQRVDVATLLPESVRQALFTEAVAAP